MNRFRNLLSTPGPLSALAQPSNSRMLELFSSHSWDHGYRRSDMHNLLAPDWVKGEDFRDHSVTVRHPLHDVDGDARLFDVLRDKIQQCDVFLVFAGMEASHSEWMPREILIARTLKVPIVAVIPNGQAQRSKIVMDFANAHSHWRSQSLRETILSQLSSSRRTEFENRLKARMLAEIVTGPRASPASVGDVLDAVFPTPRPYRNAFRDVGPLAGLGKK